MARAAARPKLLSSRRVPGSRGALVATLEPYVVEARARLDTPAERRLLDSLLRAAAERALEAGDPVRFVSSVYLPSRAVLVCIVEAGDESSLLRLLAAASIHAFRVEP